MTKARIYLTGPRSEDLFLEFSSSDPFGALLPEIDADLSHVVVITLLKIKLFFNIRALRSWTILLHKIPVEILHAIRLYGLLEIPTSTVINAYDLPNDTHVIQTLHKQIKQLVSIVNTINEYFWSALLDLDDHKGRISPKREEHGTDEEDQDEWPLPPGKHSFLHREQSSGGTTEEMQFTLRHSHDAWVETLGSIDVIRVLSQLN